MRNKAILCIILFLFSITVTANTFIVDYGSSWWTEGQMCITADTIHVKSTKNGFSKLTAYNKENHLISTINYVRWFKKVKKCPWK